jgi:lysine 2,3-aminomutase
VEFVRHSGAREVILSGGDPLALSDRKLLEWVDALRRWVPVVRIHTRAPITQPSRVTPELVSALAQRNPTWIFVHANHPAELGQPVREAIARLVDAGLPVLNQAVLLRGVNDQVETLVDLCTALVQCRVKPYYLHQTDPVPGNAALRVEPSRGLALHRALAQRVSGLALPRYVVDLEDGSGKVDVADWYAARTGGVPSRTGYEVRSMTDKE